MVTILTDAGHTVADARPDGDALWIDASELERVTGWELKPEGACRGEVCVPLGPSLVRDNEVDVAGFWRHTGRPMLRSGDVCLLAEGASERRAALDSLYAPDFTLPDLDGVHHSLSSFRGSKVFLAAWASW